MTNEMLCKLLAHSLCWLIQEQAEFGIKQSLVEKDATPEPKPLPKYGEEFDFSELAFV